MTEKQHKRVSILEDTEPEYSNASNKRALRRHHAKRVINKRTKHLKDVGADECLENLDKHGFSKTHPLSCNCGVCTPAPRKPRNKRISEDD